MPTTTNYGWTTPADTDLVKDGAAAIRTLGTAIDTTTYNNANAAIAKTIVDAKGDIIAATAADTVSRLAVGANDTVLTADSSTATGLKWAAVASGGMTLISTTTLTGASVSLTSIPSTYVHLQLIIQNFKPATDNKFLSARINGDSSANRYYSMRLDGDVAGALAQAFDSTFFRMSGNNDNSVDTNLSIIDLWNYTNTTTWKFANVQSITVNATTTTSFNPTNYFGVYNQIGAITSIDLFPDGGNFTSGTALLYGVK